MIEDILNILDKELLNLDFIKSKLVVIFQLCSFPKIEIQIQTKFIIIKPTTKIYNNNNNNYNNYNNNNNNNNYNNYNNQTNQTKS